MMFSLSPVSFTIDSDDGTAGTVNIDMSLARVTFTSVGSRAQYIAFAMRDLLGKKVGNSRIMRVELIADMEAPAGYERVGDCYVTE